MKSESITRLSIDVPKTLHTVLKFHTISNHLNIKNYVVNLIKEDLSEEMEDYLLGQMALEAKKKGFASATQSKNLLNKLTKTSKTPQKKSPKK